MRVLVTGGAGFIGSHVVERYLAEGWDVTVVDDLSSGRRENVPPGVDLVPRDVAEPGLAGALEGVEFDLVNHHAAQIDVRVSVAEPGRDARVNLLGLLNLLELVRSRGPVPVVFASSGGVMYGEAEVTPTPEGAPKRAYSPYGVAKLASEYYLQYYALVHGLRYLALRYGNVYGPRQNPEGEAGVVSIFCGKLLKGEPLTVFGTGLQDRDFVFVKDVAEVNWLASHRLVDGGAGRPAAAAAAAGSGRPAAANAGPGAVAAADAGSASIGAPPINDAAAAGEPVDAAALNVGTGRATSVLDLVRSLGRHVGGELEVRHATARAGELLHSSLDPRKAERVLGWTPRTSLDEGLAATYRYFASPGGPPA